MDVGTLQIEAYIQRKIKKKGSFSVIAEVN